MTWSSTHGNGAIVEPSSNFQVTPTNGYCTVKARSNLVGNVHFCVPSVPAGSNNITGIKVEFTSQNASVDAVTIWQGNISTPAGANLNWVSTDSKKLGNELAVAGSSFGIDITIGVKFDNPSSASYIRFQSVGLSYA